jgi:hypothetical protein
MAAEASFEVQPAAKVHEFEPRNPKCTLEVKSALTISMMVAAALLASERRGDRMASEVLERSANVCDQHLREVSTHPVSYEGALHDEVTAIVG